MLAIRSFRRRLAATALAATAAAGMLAAAPSDDAQAAVKRLVKRDWCKAYGDKPVTQVREELAMLAMDCLINRARSAAGVPPLRRIDPVVGGLSTDAPLYKAARAHAEKSEAVRWWSPTDGATSHIDPDTKSTPRDRILGQGFCPYGREDLGTRATNENTFTSSGVWKYPATPRGAVNWWLDDPPHRETLLSPVYQYHSIAIVPGLALPGAQYDPAGTFVQDLGRCDDW
jgi:uncharacterized protein YkwD